MHAEPETPARFGAAAPPADPRAATAAGQRDQAWRRDRRGRVHVYGPLYRSGFLAAFVCGRLDDGADLALAVGSHASHYPFAHPRSRWDEFLLLAGDERLLVSGRRISPLGIALGPGRRATVAYHGRAFRMAPGGAPDASRAVAVDVDLNLDLDSVVHHPRIQGIGLRRPLIGLQWQPALVRGSGSLTLDGRRRRIDHAAGLMERGSLANLRGKLFQFAYDYLAVCRPDGEPAAYVRFATAPLHTGMAGLPLRLLLATGIANEEVTLTAARPLHGDVHGLAPGPTEPVTALVGHRIELGPGTLVSELIAIGDTERRYGLRQIVRRRDTPGAAGSFR